VELGRARFRQKLLNEMRGPDRPWLTGLTAAGSLLMVLAAIYFDKKQSNPRLEFVSVCTIAVALNCPVMSYTNSASRRLNALIKILEEDGQLDPISKRAAETVKQEL